MCQRHNAVIGLPGDNGIAGSNFKQAFFRLVLLDQRFFALNEFDDLLVPAINIHDHIGNMFESNVKGLDKLPVILGRGHQLTGHQL